MSTITKSKCCNKDVDFHKGSYMGSGNFVCRYCDKTCDVIEVELPQQPKRILTISDNYPAGHNPL